ncbi:two-component sensor histidine kinase [Chondrocystis sp. NIES-4102]|nr:two-component sensor histidine kinase [Chondrocystis sp. NIES-4102]
MDISKILTREKDDIIQQWVEAIALDQQIQSSQQLTFQSIIDHLPNIFQNILDAIDSDWLQYIATKENTCIYSRNKEDFPILGDTHGATRARQDFDAEEIVREYVLLKKILLAKLEPHLLLSDSKTTLDTIKFIDIIINQFMAKSFNSYTKERLEQLEKLQIQLLLTNQELTRLIEGHRDSLSYLTHEIKNPLTSIIGYSDLFLRQQKNLNTQNTCLTNIEHIEQVLKQGRKILRIVNDTKELASYQSGNMNLHWQNVEICSLLESILLSFKSTIEAKNLHLSASCSPDRLIICTDSLRLQQIITNLISNAIRYTKSGTIEVKCIKIPPIKPSIKDYLKIIVKDSGIGIKTENQERIFEPYFQIKEANEMNLEGMGLGLAIVAQLVKMLNGKIKLSSKVNVGSTFTVILPIINQEDD